MKTRTLLWIPALLSVVGAGAAVVLLWPKAPPRAALPAAGPEPAPWPDARRRVLLHLNRRVGRIEERESSQGDVRTTQTRTVLHVQRGDRRGITQRLVTASAGPDGALRTAELVAGGLKTRAVALPGALRLVVEVGGERFEHRLPAPRPVHVEATLFRALARAGSVGPSGPSSSGLTPRRPMEIALLDLEHAATRPVVVEVTEATRWHGIPAHRVVLREASGVEWWALLDAQGAVLESDSLVPGVGTRAWGPGDDDRPFFALDMTTWGRVLTIGSLKDPRRVRRLTLRLVGLPEKMGVPTEQVLEVPALPEGGAAAWKDAPKPPSPFVESDAAEIVALARELLPEGTGIVEAARRLNDWTSKNIRQGDVIGPPSALFTLRTKRGNCNEIAALAAALLRAAGFEARLAVGIAHQQGVFRYHAWPEVRTPTGWLAFDPTLGQVPADVTHVRLAAGGIEAQAAILSAVGRLKLEILSATESSS